MEVSVVLVLQMRGRAGVITSTASTHRALHQHKEPFPTGRPADLCRDSYSHEKKSRETYREPSYLTAFLKTSNMPVYTPGEDRVMRVLAISRG